jgi:hypothetical protein
MKLLTAAEAEQFIDKGYVVIRNAFPRELADAILPWVWEQMALSPTDRTGWTRHTVHLKTFYRGGLFEQVYTQRLRSAVDDLLGDERWVVPDRSGWWPCRFPGFAVKPWVPPESGWHVDGIHQHHLTSPDQGLLGIMIFSEIEPGDGGTAISLGSHHGAARILADAEPAGLTPGQISERVNALPKTQVLEVTGSPGDIALMHPFMLHCASPNTGDKVRIVTNKTFPLKQPMNLSRQTETDYSLVERAILRAR